jgi:NADH:ubiquinone oxidoreductase subunit 6 (subunit J)
MTNKMISAALVIVLALLMIATLTKISWPVANPDTNSNSDLGIAMFGNEQDPGFSPVLMMIAILLLVALLGAVFLAKEEEGGKR